jgi:hypothetical protein
VACVGGMMMGLFGCVHVVRVTPYGRPAGKRWRWAKADDVARENLQLGAASRISNRLIIRVHCFVVKTEGIDDGGQKDLCSARCELISTPDKSPTRTDTRLILHVEHNGVTRGLAASSHVKSHPCNLVGGV